MAAVHRTDGSRDHLPTAERTLTGGDVAYLIGPYEELLGMLGGR